MSTGTSTDPSPCGCEPSCCADGEPVDGCCDETCCDAGTTAAACC